MPLLELERVSKRFGGVLAVREVSLSVEAGEICGLMGANGAGKTTLFSLIAGHSKPDARRHPLRRQIAHAFASGSDLPARNRPHIPDREAVRRPERRRQSRDRRVLRYGPSFKRRADAAAFCRGILEDFGLTLRGGTARRHTHAVRTEASGARARDRDGRASGADRRSDGGAHADRGRSDAGDHPQRASQPRSHA